jgi:hypothetical protein
MAELKENTRMEEQTFIVSLDVVDPQNSVTIVQYESNVYLRITVKSINNVRLYILIDRKNEVAHSYTPTPNVPYDTYGCGVIAQISKLGNDNNQSHDATISLGFSTTPFPD